MSEARRSATWSGVLAILLWSSLALMTLVTATLPPFEVLAISFAIGGASMLMVARGSLRDRLVSLRQPWSAFALAVFALLGYHALYFIAFRHAPAIEVNLINYLWPLLIVVLSVWLPNVRVHFAQLAGSALGLLGVAVMLVQGHGISLRPEYLLGYLAAFSAALTWSGYSVLNRRHEGVPSSAIAGACLLVAAIAALLHCGFEISVAPTRMQWMILILMGLGPVGVAFRLWDRGTKHGDLALLGTLSYAAPVLSTLLLLLSGRVQAHWSQAVALLFLLIGAWLSIRASTAD
ncbi:MAG: EamA family transporter [Dokdonella sp.]